MSNNHFQFRRFTVQQDRCAMKITTDSCLFGAWVAHQIKNEKISPENALDIGTGTGLLSLMVAQKNMVPIDTIEIDTDSWEQAKENIAASPWKEKITAYQGDARNFEFKKKYDIVFCNPPFYEKELKSDDPRRNTALHSSDLSFEDLMRLIHDNLSPDGLFFLLLPYKRREELQPLLSLHDLCLKEIIFVRQSDTHDYFRIMLKGKIRSEKCYEYFFDELSVWNDLRQYTDEFKGLLREYYLYL